jgi:hypothetical protein
MRTTSKPKEALPEEDLQPEYRSMIAGRSPTGFPIG